MSNGVVVVPRSLKPADMQLRVIGPATGQPMDQPRVAVVGEDDRLVGGEQGIELGLRQAVGVCGIWL